MSIMGKGYEYTNADRAGGGMCSGDFVRLGTTDLAGPVIKVSCVRTF
jgi:hypothetical protein